MTTGFIYVIESIEKGNRYLGSTSNPKERIIYHNRGRVKATRNGAPWKYVLILNVGDVTEARKIEYYAKRQKISLLKTENIIKILYWYYQKKGL